VFKNIQLVFLLILIFVYSACSGNKSDAPSSIPPNETLNLLKTDNDFALSSAEKGIKNAYLEYVDSNGVLLRPNSLPIIGADAIDYIIAMQDERYSMTWRPNEAIVAASGELGYTYGTYKLQPSNGDASFYGTYVSIWKKQADGKWKFVLNTGNEGVGE
jgi:ketosteroid isomerase-like protein